MTTLWDVDGENIDVGYRNIRRAMDPCEQDLRDALDQMWKRYEPFADTDFAQGFARDPEARFWVMYLAIRLLDAGKELLPALDRPRAGGKPDICVIEPECRIWIEAIAPDRGIDGPDQVRGPKPLNEGGGFTRAPKRQAQLRMTSALWTKYNVLRSYLRDGTIAPDDIRLIAISASRFGQYVSEHPIPLIVSSLFPIGDEFVSIDQEGNVVNQGFEESLLIERQDGVIPRTAFLDETFSAVSGVVWSRASLGNFSAQVRPLTLVHNPLAAVPISQNWGVWDREFVTLERADGWTTEDILGWER